MLLIRPRIANQNKYLKEALISQVTNYS